MIQEFPVKTQILMQLHYSRLSEKDRRQYAALEALKLGHGGITYISKVLGIDRKTISQGKKELLSTAVLIAPHKQRRLGGGRKKNCKTS